MNRVITVVLAVSLSLVMPSPASAQGTESTAPPLDSPLGTVALSTSCTPGAEVNIARGLALLHHMTYPAARSSFAAAAEHDPECAFAYWGQAMSFIHPLWPDEPTAEQLKEGQELVRRAESARHKDALAEAMIAAVANYYENAFNRSEAERLRHFEEGWGKVYQVHSDRPEAALFYALAHMATASLEDETFAERRRAGAIAERVLEDIPDHPGAHHYAIHAYDVPALADRALEVARSYGELAPGIPHALHMPTHIFTRLGLWDESVAFNRRSADAALQHSAGGHYLHAVDYLVYAYLQRAEYENAEAVFEELQTHGRPYVPHGASAYTLAAVPSRIALEQGDWARAAAVMPTDDGEFPWEHYPQFRAIVPFARALGAARLGDVDDARREIAELEEISDALAETAPYWSKQIAIQAKSAEAWLVFEAGESERGLELMEEAAAMEAETETHGVTPGEVLPAAELLGDMLMKSGRFEDALAQYRRALQRSPNRFNSLYGAAHSAEEAGNAAEATRFYEQLLLMAPAADAREDELARARSFLAGNR